MLQREGLSHGNVNRVVGCPTRQSEEVVSRCWSLVDPARQRCIPTYAPETQAWVPGIGVPEITTLAHEGIRREIALGVVGNGAPDLMLLGDVAHFDLRFVAAPGKSQRHAPPDKNMRVEGGHMLEDTLARSLYIFKCCIRGAAIAESQSSSKFPSSAAPT